MKEIYSEPHFENIQETLIKELQAATRSIYVAVAWFTDRRLFEQLIDKLKDNVRVAVVIVKDEINEYSNNNFERIKEQGGDFFEIEGVLMHNKFCIIDSGSLLQALITGHTMLLQRIRRIS